MPSEADEFDDVESSAGVDGSPDPVDPEAGTSAAGASVSGASETGTSASGRALRGYQRGWPDVGFFTEARGCCRPFRAKNRVRRFTQGAARGLALPWANEWLRLWREEAIGSHARIDEENALWAVGPATNGLPGT